jgi:hypothetical protein
MIRNYLVSTYRSLVSNKVNAIINITGLAISIACCIFIYVFVKHEKSFDNFHSKRDRIYRIVFDDKGSQGTSYNGYVSFPTPAALRQDFPQLETVTQVYVHNKAIIGVEESNGERKLFEENEMTYADEYFPEHIRFQKNCGQ